jgi:hypothetical protein
MKGITLIVLIVASAMIGSAVGMAGTVFESTSTEMSHIGEVIESDNTFNITTRLYVAPASDDGSAQNVSTQQEIAPSSYPIVRVTDIAKGSFTYEVTIAEKNDSSASSSTATWKVIVYKDGNPITAGNPSGQDYVIIKNQTTNNSVIEGIRLRYDLTKTFNGGTLEVKVIKLTE